MKDEEIVSLTGNTQVYVNDKGVMSMCHDRQILLKIILFPFDRGFEQPYPYTRLVSKCLPIPVPIAEKKRVDKSWRVSGADEHWMIVRKAADWQLRQEIRLNDGLCTITSFIDNQSGSGFPQSFNIMALPSQSFWDDAKCLLVPGVQGRTKIVPFSGCREGEISKSLLAVQKENIAVLIHSETGCANPLVLGFFDNAWHGFVNLPPTPSGNSLLLGTINIRVGLCAQTLLEEFAARTAVKHSLKPAPKCWNSWDYYHSSVSAGKILENANAIAADPVLKANIDCIVVDMGWEVRFGEWTADPNFPGGMASLAAEIKKLGFQAGLWLAPVIIDPECNFFQDDYKWVGKNRYGFPDRTFECCGLFGYVLDVTRRKGADYLRQLFRRFRDMGYTYFKLDFLRYLMYAHRFHNGRLTNVEIMRQALKLIREGAGDDAYILGCNLPFEVGPGYCDACRVSSDVRIFWGDIKANASAITCSYFFNGRWWLNDPDFMIVRGKDTARRDASLYGLWWFPRDDEADKEIDLYRRLHDRQATLLYEEARTWASFVLMVGGAYALSDPIRYLNTKGMDLIRRVVSARTCPGRPLKLFSSNGLSAFWKQELDDRTRIGVFNWEDECRGFALNIDTLGINHCKKTATDFWTGEKINIEDKKEITLYPHASRVFEFFR